MGCRSSKAEEPPLVGLCRERRELIRAAADYRYALATAHGAYFRALDRVGEALHRFVQEELEAAAAAAGVAASPVITLPPSDGKGKEKADARRSDGDGNAGDVGASSSSSLRSMSHAHSSDRHLHFPSGSDSEEISEEENEEVPEVPQESSRRKEGLERGGGREGNPSSPLPNPPPPFAPFPPLSAVPPPFYAVYPPFSNYPVPPSSSYPMSPFSAVPPPSSNYPIPNYYYMKSSATIPTTIYQEPYTGWSDSGYMGYGYGYTNPLYGNPRGSPPTAPVGDESFHRNREVRTAIPSPPPPPPPPQSGGSSWDFFNPFDSYEQLYSEFLKEKYGMISVTSSPNSSEVREREGIPDLEEETEQEIVKEDVESRKEVDGSSGNKDSGAESSKAAEVEREVGEKEDTIVSEVKESQSNSEVSKVKSSGEKQAHLRKKGASFEEETSLVTEDSEASKESAVYAHGTRDVVEAVKEIKEQFKSAASSGEEVSRMLEVGKLRYRSRSRILRGGVLN